MVAYSRCENVPRTTIILADVGTHSLVSSYTIILNQFGVHMKIDFMTYLKKSYYMVMNNKPAIAYSLVIVMFLYRYILSASPPESVFVGLAFTLMAILFDIHAKVTEEHKPMVFDCFESAKQSLYDQINFELKRQKLIKIRYFGLVGYHWQDIESYFEALLNNNRHTSINIMILLIDSDHPRIGDVSDAWQCQSIATRKWVEAFKNRNFAAIKQSNWSIDVRLYQDIPQIWGISIDESAALFGTSYWHKYEKEENGQTVSGYVLRGGSNPLEMIRTEDGDIGCVRIKNFVSWFDHFWGGQGKT
jgi:hypothetical protein